MAQSGLVTTRMHRRPKMGELIISALGEATLTSTRPIRTKKKFTRVATTKSVASVTVKTSFGDLDASSRSAHTRMAIFIPLFPQTHATVMAHVRMILASARARCPIIAAIHAKEAKGKVLKVARTRARQPVPQDVPANSKTALMIAVLLAVVHAINRQGHARVQRGLQATHVNSLTAQVQILEAMHVETGGSVIAMMENAFARQATQGSNARKQNAAMDRKETLPT